jgi:flagellar export protein FliJ
MIRSKRIEPIRDIASNSAKDLSVAVAEAARRVAEIERAIEQLKAYRDEYTQSSGGSVGATDAVRLQNYRSFLDRLGEAMRLQAQALIVARAEYDKRHALWSAKRIEAESLDRAVGRFRLEEQRDADRREQREMDDSTLRSLARRI